jgi:pilus assembly protein TadC
MKEFTLKDLILSIIGIWFFLSFIGVVVGIFWPPAVPTLGFLLLFILVGGLIAYAMYKGRLTSKLESVRSTVEKRRLR